MKLQTAISFIEHRFEPIGVEACLVNSWEDGGGEYRVRVFGQFRANGNAFHQDFADAELAAQYLAEITAEITERERSRAELANAPAFPQAVGQLDFIEGCIVRTARKQHQCQARADTIPNAERSPLCTERIQPGDQYVEYLGATPAYQSGKRYCLSCAGHSLVIRRADTT